MSKDIALKLTPEEANEMPMVDLAYKILQAINSPLYYRDLMNEVAKIKGISEEEVNRVIAQLYTEINIDGRFACVGDNMWGLKRWYPVEKTDEVGSSSRPRIINDDDDDEEELELLDEELLDEEDGEYDEDLDGYDNDVDDVDVVDDDVDDLDDTDPIVDDEEDLAEDFIDDENLEQDEDLPEED